MGIELQSIGTVQSTRNAVFDDDWDRETTWIALDSRFSEDALASIG